MLKIFEESFPNIELVSLHPIKKTYRKALSDIPSVLYHTCLIQYSRNAYIQYNTVTFYIRQVISAAQVGNVFRP